MYVSCTLLVYFLSMYIALPNIEVLMCRVFLTTISEKIGQNTETL